jgi:hypothetical protein
MTTQSAIARASTKRMYLCSIVAHMFSYMLLAVSPNASRYFHTAVKHPKQPASVPSSSQSPRKRPSPPSPPVSSQRPNNSSPLSKRQKLDSSGNLKQVLMDYEDELVCPMYVSPLFNCTYELTIIVMMSVLT